MYIGITPDWYGVTIAIETESLSEFLNRAKPILCKRMGGDSKVEFKVKHWNEEKNPVAIVSVYEYVGNYESTFKMKVYKYFSPETIIETV